MSACSLHEVAVCVGIVGKPTPLSGKPLSWAVSRLDCSIWASWLQQNGCSYPQAMLTLTSRGDGVLGADSQKRFCVKFTDNNYCTVFSSVLRLVSKLTWNILHCM